MITPFVKDYYTIDPGLVLWFPFNGDAKDFSGKGNHGTINGASWVSGKVNQALQFDGSDDYVSTGISYFSQNEGSISLWVIFKSISGTYRITDGAGNWGRIYSTNVTLYFDLGGADFVSWVGLEVDKWFHIVVTWTGGDSITLYINSIARSTNASVTCPAIPSNFNVGVDSDNSTSPFDGVIDEVRVYNRTLNSKEIWNIYQKLV